MIDSIKRYVQEQNMFAEGDYVVAGVSGGADSICLLCVLLELRLEIPMTIQVVHINHKIREEAGEDAAYVEAFCRERQLPFRWLKQMWNNWRHKDIYPQKKQEEKYDMRLFIEY